MGAGHSHHKKSKGHRAGESASVSASVSTSVSASATTSAGGDVPPSPSPVDSSCGGNNNNDSDGGSNTSPRVTLQASDSLSASESSGGGMRPSKSASRTKLDKVKHAVAGETKREKEEAEMRRELPNLPSQRAVQSLLADTGVHRADLTRLRAEFERVADADGQVDRAGFRRALDAVAADGLADDLKHGNPVLQDRLFDVFDTDKSGTLDVLEFCVGMLPAVSGTQEQKLELTFKAFDRDENGYIDRGEMFKMFRCCYLRLLDAALEHERPDDLDADAVEHERKRMAATARQLVDSAFALMDKDNNGKVSFNEFREWAATAPEITAALDEHTQIHVPLLLHDYKETKGFESVTTSQKNEACALMSADPLAAATVVGEGE